MNSVTENVSLSDGKVAFAYLIHGVGETNPGEMKRAVRDILRKDGTKIIIEEINWGEAVASAWVTSSEGAKSLSIPYCYNTAKSVRTSISVIRKRHLLDVAERKRFKLTFGFRIVDGCIKAGFIVVAAGVAGLLGVKLALGVVNAMFLENLPNLPSSLLLYPVYIGVCVGCLGIILEAMVTCVALLVAGGNAVMTSISGGIAAIVLRLFCLTFVCGIPIIATIAAIQEIFHAFRSTFSTPLTSRIFQFTSSAIVVVAVLGAFLKHAFIVASLGALVKNHSQEIYWILIATPAMVLISSIFAFQVKVIGDIFHYIADPNYRNSIQEFVKNSVKSANESSGDIIILAHSLGSVIALDYLWNMANEWQDRKIFLVTGGSPLRRFFFRYFPDLLFPSDTSTCVVGLRSKFLRFSWHNVYRLTDYVGQRIGLPKFGHHSETRIFRLFRWHTGYWGDNKVRRIIARLWDEESHTEEFSPIMFAIRSGVSDSDSESGNNYLLSIALVCCFLLPIVTFFASILYQDTYSTHNQQLLSSNPPSYYGKLYEDDQYGIDGNSEPDVTIIYTLVPDDSVHESAHACNTLLPFNHVAMIDIGKAKKENATTIAKRIKAHEGLLLADRVKFVINSDPYYFLSVDYPPNFGWPSFALAIIESAFMLLVISLMMLFAALLVRGIGVAFTAEDRISVGRADYDEHPNDPMAEEIPL